jgi:transcriptional regulator with PAS, ATPase and Fis domain
LPRPIAIFRAGAFRQDLYYRLNVIALTMPPLRQRREDIPLLASYFASKCGRECGRAVSGISREARDLLTRYDWPGNVRELENVMERAVVLGTTEEILSDDLPESIVEFGGESAIDDPVISGGKFHENIRLMKHQLVLKALEQSNQSYPEAARLLGLHPNNLHRLAKNLNLKATK